MSTTQTQSRLQLERRIAKGLRNARRSWMQDILAPDRHASDGDEDNNGWWLVMDQRPADGGGSKPAARFRVVGRSGDEFEVEYAISHHDTTSATREHHGDTGTVIQRILGLLEGIHLFASSQRKRYHEKFSLDD